MGGCSVTRKAGEILRDIVTAQGRPIIDDPRRLRAMLNDLTAGRTGEISLVLAALEAQVPHKLLDPGGAPAPLVQGRLAEDLQTRLFITGIAAQWAVQTWAFALDLSPTAPPAPGSAPPGDAEEQARRQAEEETRKEQARKAQQEAGEQARGEMIGYAKSLLDDKQYSAAAAVFKFAASQKPQDSSLPNNIGFCLIPEDPLEALRYLKAAAEMNYERRAMNAYNQMCCHIAQRHPYEALGIADAIWPDVHNVRSPVAILWKRDDQTGDWVMFNADDDRIAIAELAIALANEEGWSIRERDWRERKEQLSG